MVRTVKMDGRELPPVRERRRLFGEALAERRLEQNLSQSKLGELLGVGQSAVSSWELGEAEPPVETVYFIEEVLKVRPGVLSKHLGWLPLTILTARRGGPAPKRVLDVLDGDPDYDELGRRLIRTLCKELRKKR